MASKVQPQYSEALNGIYAREREMATAGKDSQGRDCLPPYFSITVRYVENGEVTATSRKETPAAVVNAARQGPRTSLGWLAFGALDEVIDAVNKRETV